MIARLRARLHGLRRGHQVLRYHNDAGDSMWLCRKCARRWVT